MARNGQPGGECYPKMSGTEAIRTVDTCADLYTLRRSRHSRQSAGQNKSGEAVPWVAGPKRRRLQGG